MRSRALIAATVCVAMVLGFTGCAVFFPSRANEAPIFLTARDGSVVFRWCGDTTGQYEAMEIEYRLTEGREKRYITAAEGGGVFQLQPGQEFTSSAPPAGLTYETSGPIPVDQYPIVIFLYTENAEFSGELANFQIEPPDTIEEGRWRAPGGPVDDVPC